MKVFCSGVARGRGRQGGRLEVPQSEAQTNLNPQLNVTLYRGLWRAAILSPFSHPCLPLTRPYRPLILKSLATPLVFCPVFRRTLQDTESISYPLWFQWILKKIINIGEVFTLFAMWVEETGGF